jgi:hypothetical protein
MLVEVPVYAQVFVKRNYSEIIRFLIYYIAVRLPVCKSH